MFVLFIMQSYLIEVRGLKRNICINYTCHVSRIL